jgi:hypothetical protein
MRLKIRLIFILKICFFNQNVFATSEPMSNGTGNYSLVITLDKSVYRWFYDSINLYSNNLNFKADIEINPETKAYTLKWANLPKGRYLLKLKNVFGDASQLNFNVRRDTSFVIVNKYEMVDSQKIEHLNYKNSSLIKIYFESSGCFHGFKEIFLIERASGDNYKCTFIADSIAYKDSMKRMFIEKIPTYKFTQTKASILDDLVRLVKTSAYEQDKANRSGVKCVSTTHNNLFVLSGNSLFQFYDFGICNLDNLYNVFVRRYFPIKEE